MNKHLTKDERYYIFKRITNLISISQIARELAVNKSTVSREIKRNSSHKALYDSDVAHKLATSRKSNAHASKRFKNISPQVLNNIKLRLSDGWSPEQISGRFKATKQANISHQTIYNYVHHDKANGGNLYKLLPHKGKKYAYKASTKYRGIPNRIDISQRPNIANKKARIGDFEADTIVGRKDGSYQCLLTLVDRKSKYTFVRKIAARSAYYGQQCIEDICLKTIIPFKTITPDNGGEFAHHQQIQEKIGCKFYFARPYHSCDRGLNEHTNGLIRRYLPKKTDFATVSDDKIKYIQELLNNRPRKVLGYLTPKEIMLKYLNRIYPKSHPLLLMI